MKTKNNHINDLNEQTEGNSTDHIRPSVCISTLQAYNESVFMLVETCQLAIDHNLVDSSISDNLKLFLGRVQKFYK